MSPCRFGYPHGRVRGQRMRNGGIQRLKWNKMGTSIEGKERGHT